MTVVPPMTVAEVAAALRVSEYTVREQLRAGKFPNATKPGRKWLIPAADVRKKLGY